MSRLPLARLLLIVPVLVAEPWSAARASDHADPIDVAGRNRQEPGLTDLFVFPVLRDDSPAFPRQRTAGIPLTDQTADLQGAQLTVEQRNELDALVIILCARRQLTDRTTLELDSIRYTVHMDFTSPVVTHLPEEDRAAAPASHPAPGEAVGDQSDADSENRPMPPHSHSARPTVREAIARYGGWIREPSEIHADASVTFQLNDDATLNGAPRYGGRLTDGWSGSPTIRFTSGVYDDPFIFPAFFGTNVVAMAIRIPVELLPADSDTVLVWATSHRLQNQLDHVGRSARTQNPRFDLLNTLPPSRHVAALLAEHEQPSLVRDLKLRAGLGSLFAYREWDFVPDVLILSLRHEVGFPNGRLLTDDVAALLARQGETQLWELSHHNATWPRRQTNDKPFAATFPYLAEPWVERPQPTAPGLTTASILKLIGLGVLLLLLLAVENALVVYLVHRWKARRRFL